MSQWRERVRCLRAWMPELALPDLSDAALLATLDAWLLPAFAGKTRLDALAADELAEALKSTLDWSTRQRIEQLAPMRIVVPSGMERRIDYAFDDAADEAAAPVLAVKLQELFGLADTPRIADGRVPLTLHLLSPGRQAAAGHPGPARLLGPHLSGSAQGNEGALSAASVAGRSVDGDRDPSRQAARHVMVQPADRLLHAA